MVKILIMDDEPGLRNIVFNMLKPLGYPLFTAEDGHQAIEIAKREIPDLAMLDMRVPDMDGLEALAELKKINPNIKAIMLSGFGDVDSAIEALKKGANEYISKPFKVDEVLAAVRKTLGTIPQAGGTAPAAPQAAAVPPPAPAPVKKAPIPDPKKPVPASAAADGAAPSTIKIGISKKMVTLGLVAGLIALIAGGGFFAWKSGLIGAASSETFSIPYTNQSGITLIRPYLWITDASTGNIYKHNRDASLSIDSIYKTANTQPTGITFDGQSIWTCSAAKQRIYKHKVDKDLTIEAIFATPNNPTSIYFDAGDLWVLDTAAGKIYKHKTDEALSPQAEYNSPVANPCGMFRNGEFFYVGDAKTGKICKVSSGDFAVTEVYAVPNFTSGKYKLANIAWDGKNIWATADNAGKVVRIPLTSLKAVEF